MTRYKLVTEETQTIGGSGVWLEEISLLKAIKHLKYKNKSLYSYFIERYETLTGKKFTEESIKHL
ncbi:MAG: hypothetical protein ACOC5T_05045 [Elusimicrobiota bacterium]